MLIASAQRPDLDTATIAERFAEATGSPPMAFVDAGRASVVRRLSRSDELSMMQIARLVGFRSYNELSRVVRLGSQSPEQHAHIAQHHVAGAAATAAEIEPLAEQLGETLSGIAARLR